MTDYNAIFMGISAAKPINNYAARIPVGQHRVMLKRYAVKPSQQGNGIIVEADFVLSSTGETRGWAWFPTSAGWAGAYEQGRSKEFLEACAACIGDKRDVALVGPDLAGPQQKGRGLILQCEVTAQVDAATGAPKTNKKGQPLLNIVWKPVQQTLEQLAANRAKLDASDPLPQAGVAQASQPQPTHQVAQQMGAATATPVVTQAAPSALAFLQNLPGGQPAGGQQGGGSGFGGF